MKFLLNESADARLAPYLRLGEYADLATKVERVTDVLSHHATQLEQFLVVMRQRIRVRTAPAETGDATRLADH